MHSLERIVEGVIMGILALFLVVLIFGGAQDAFGQASTIPFDMQYLSNAGTVLSSGKICTFSAGTNTPLTSYTSPTAGASNTNPVVLDASGRGAIFLTNGVGYKIILYAAGGDSNCPNSGTTIWTRDNIMVGNPGTVAPGTGTANRVAKYITSTTMDDGSIQDLYSGESMRIQADNTVSIGTTSDVAVGLHVYTAESIVFRGETTTGTSTLNLSGTSGLMGMLSASVSGGVNLGTTAAFLNLNTAGTSFTPTTTGAMALGTAANRFLTSNVAGMTAITLSLSSGTSAELTLSGAAPTISSGFGTSPSVTGTAAAMRVNVGTGGVATGGVIGMPTASNGWNCTVENLTATLGNVANARTVQISSTTTTVSIENQTISTGAVLVWTASDIIAVSCLAF